MASASGGRALGRIDVSQGPALYLALEDTGRRLQDRLGRVLADDSPPAALTLATTCPPLPAGGQHAISAWLTEHKSARLVVIDVLARVRGHVGRDLPAYDADYRAVTQAKAVADWHGVPFVIVHHTRKAAADDFLDEVSGTQGVAGAADSVAVLKRIRGRADAILHVTGRDVEETSLALAFDPATGSWQLSDVAASEVMMGETRAAILAWLRECDGSFPKHIADGTGLDYELVKKTCARMAEDAQLHTDGRGRYFVPPGTL